LQLYADRLLGWRKDDRLPQQPAPGQVQGVWLQEQLALVPAELRRLLEAGQGS
jgi:hypothetical protein